MNSKAKLGDIDLRGVLVPAVLILTAQILSSWRGVDQYTLATPVQIVLAGFEALLDGSLLYATAQTLLSALGGLALGTAFGVTIGLSLGLMPRVNKLLDLTIEMVRPIPSVALIPIAMLIFGLGFRMEIAIIAFATGWPSLIFTRSAVVDVEPQLIEVSRALGFGAISRALKIILPAALPRILLAFRLGIGTSLLVAVTVEIASNPIGVGSTMMLAQQALNPALTLALLIWMGLLGWGLRVISTLLQKRLFGVYVAR